MKTKYVWIVVLIALCTQAGYAQKNMDQLFKEFANAKNVTRVSLGNFSMKLAGMFTDVMGVNGVEVLSLDDCSESIKSNFQSALSELKDAGYETMVSANEGGERTRVLVKIKDETIKELVVFVTGDSHSLIRIKGNIKPSDIDRLVKEHRDE
jgi:type 1 fimbria pilin